MNEALTTELLDVVKSAKVGVVRGIEILYEQIPDLVHQVLLYGAIDAGIGLVCGAILLGITTALFTLAVKLVRREGFYFDHDGLAPVVLCIVAILPGVGGVVTTLFNVSMLAKIYLAPKMYLLDYLQGVIK